MVPRAALKKGFKYHYLSSNHVEWVTVNKLFHKFNFGLHKGFRVVLYETGTQVHGV